MNRLEQRLARLETLASPTENKNGPKVFCVEKLSVEKWNKFVAHREDFELKPLLDEKDGSQTVRMEFVEIK